MKRVLAAGMISLALAPAAFAQGNSFINTQVINSPPNPAPQGNAANYVNLNSISVSVGVPFHFYDMLNFTNRGVMAADVGFLFNYTPSAGGPVGAMSTFFNTNNASSSWEISAASGSSGTLSSLDVVPPAIFPQLRIWATNVNNGGVLDVGATGIIKIDATNAYLTRGTLNVEGFDRSISASGPPFGLFDSIWGVGTQNNTISASSVPPSLNVSGAGTNSQGSGSSVSISGSPPQSFSLANIISTNNHVYQAIFMGPTSATTAWTKMDAMFVSSTTSDFAEDEVRFIYKGTNVFGSLVSNIYYLTDTLASSTNPTGLRADQVTVGGITLYCPSNYTMSINLSGFTPALTNYDPGIFDPTIAFPTNTPRRVPNNTYSAYQVQGLPVTFQPDPSNPSQTYSNLPGRVEITASNLNLTRTKITGPNFLNLRTSNLVSSANAQLEFPAADLDLSSPNSQLVISNLILPYLVRPTGTIDMYSAVWQNTITSNIFTTNFTTNTTTLTNGTSSNTIVTNIATNGFPVTNRYHVLYVLSDMQPISPTFQEFVTLRSSNVILSDQLNIASNLTSDAVNFTVGSNNLAGYPTGITFGNSSILWSPSFPRLQNFTNWGTVTVGNTAYFSHRATPDFNSPGDSSYSRFINHGTIQTSGGNYIWSDYFENTLLGTNPAFISSGVGGLSVQANTALLGSGTMDASLGDMSISAGNLTVTNTVLNTDGGLFLTIGSSITDFGSLGNSWTTGAGLYGYNGSAASPLGDLLGTKIRVNAGSNMEPDIIWSAEDRGTNLTGFTNNQVVGNLLLFGADSGSAFHFGAGGFSNNAIYIDRLDLLGTATNPAAFDIDSNMKVYFAKAFYGTTNLGFQLSQAAGGRLIWMPRYNNGPFDILSGGQAASPSLQITVTGQQSMGPLLSWQSIPNATNGLYRTTNAAGNSWSLITNVVVGAESTVRTVQDTATTPGFYRLRIDPIAQ